VSASPHGAASRYKDTALNRNRATSFYSLWRRPEELARMRSTATRVRDVSEANVGRLDRISHEEYDTVSLWWVIAAANGIIDPRRDMHAGQRLLIPDFALIAAFRQRAGLAE